MNQQEATPDPHVVRQRLKQYLENEATGYAERGNYDQSGNEKVDQKVEVTERTALFMALFAQESVERLDKENERIKKVLETSTEGSGVNLSNLREEFKKNEALIKTLKENCLQTLSPIVDRILFSKKQRDS